MISKYSYLKIEAFLRTAGIEEAYAKYYSSIPRETFNEILAADPSLQLEEGETPRKIGTYGQWLLRMYTQKKLKLEDLEKTYDNLEKLIGLLPELKKKKETFDINKIKNPSELFEFVSARKTSAPPDKENLSENPEQLLTNTYFIENKEAEKVFENNDVIIIIPKTLEASQFYAEGTNWCTRYPNMFKEYTEDYPPDNKLWIIIFKNDPYKERYQFHFSSQQFMNLNDRQIDLPAFFRGNPEIEAFLKEQYFPGDTIEQVLQQSGDEKGIGIQIDKMSDLAETHSRGRTPFIDKIWEDGLLESYSDDSSFRDIVQVFSPSSENLSLISEYLKKNYPKEIAQYEEEETEIDWSDEKDVHSFIEYVDEYDIKRAYLVAHEDAGRMNMETSIQDALKRLFSDYFGIDFSNWYPGANVYISAKEISQEWYKFAGKDISNIGGIEVLLGNDHERFVPEKELDYAIERAERNSYVKDEEFNEQLKYQLEELPE